MARRDERNNGVTLFDGKPLTEDEIPARCACGHTLTQHGPDGDECSECNCEFFEDGQ